MFLGWSLSLLFGLACCSTPERCWSGGISWRGKSLGWICLDMVLDAEEVEKNDQSLSKQGTCSIPDAAGE